MKSLRFTAMTTLLAVVIIGLVACASATRQTPVSQNTPTPGVITTPLATSSPSSQAAIVIKSVSAYPPDNLATINYKKFFIDPVNERAKGKLEIKHLGGPEVIGVTDQMSALRKGTVDIIESSQSYHAGQMVEMGANQLVNPYMYKQMMGDEDFRQLRDKVYMKKLDVKVLGVAWAGEIFTFYTVKKPIKSMDDFKGLKIRSPGGYFSLITERMGATPIVVSTSEAIQAVRQGIVDGIIRAPAILITYGEAPLVKYNLTLPLSMGAVELFMNGDVWAKLPPDLQNLLLDQSAKMESLMWDVTYSDSRRAFKEGETKYGIQSTEPTDEMLVRLSEARQEILKDILSKADPQFRDDIARVFKPYLR